MAASLVVAALLVAGLGEVTRQVARTTVRVRANLEETRAGRLAEAEFLTLERADPQSLRTSASVVSAEIGGRELRFELASGANGSRVLSWSTGLGAPRSVATSGAARFELGADGVARLWAGAGEPPLLSAAPKRTAQYDCQYDVVIRDCR
jgi:hypothetical protein